MKIVKRGDLVEFTVNGIRHSVTRPNILRVAYAEDTGTVVIEIPGHTFRTRLMECKGIKAKTSEQLYHKIADLMNPRFKVI